MVTWYQQGWYAFAVLCWMVPLAVVAAEPKLTQSDVRVLIDVSGSMKKNDPKNLRVPALQLLTNLLPPKSKAGVWTFGKYVNMLVPHKTVNDSWKLTANTLAPTIKSNALRTNIGDALLKASYNWKVDDPEQKRSLLLLTDGVVDISKDEFVNAKERLRILKEILPQLKLAKVSVHTVALSKEADIELLQTISRDTDGIHHLVENADELTPIFLKIFDQATDRDALPINNNTFDVDSSVDEFTLLVFKKAGSPKSQLISPSGAKAEAASINANVAWFEEDSFDLVTIRRPEAGTWQIKADLDPDNRVMIVSDLAMHMERVPNNLLANESLQFKISLLENEKVIKRKNFLSLATVSIEMTKGKEPFFAIEALDDGKGSDELAGDGIFSANVNTGSETGKIDVKVIAESPTFKRMKRFQLNVYGSPFEFTTIISETMGVEHQIEVTPKDEVISTQGYALEVMAELPDGKDMTLAAEPLGSFRKVIRLPAVEAGGDYRIKMKASGKTIIKRDFSIALPDLVFNQPSFIKEAEIPVEPISEATEPEKEPSEQPLVEAAEAEIEASETEEGSDEGVEEESSMLLWFAIGLGANVAIALGVWFFMRTLKKKSRNTVDKLKSDLGVKSVDDIGAI